MKELQEEYLFLNREGINGWESVFQAKQTAEQKIADVDDTEDEGIDGINEIIKETEGKGTVSGKYKTALLTGATGFLGIHILKYLIDAGIKVYCLVRSEKKDYYKRGLRY